MTNTPNEPPPTAPTSDGNESVAHQIIGAFLSSLEQEQGYEEIAKRLRPALLQAKPTESTLRAALFGDDPL